MAKPSPISKAKSFPIRFHPTPSSRSRSLPALPPPSMATRPASSSLPPRVPARESPLLPEACRRLMGPLEPAQLPSIFPTVANPGATSSRSMALNTGRFLDPPEFTVFHDKGNEENFFDRVDYSFSGVDSIHVDLNYSRSWFQTPNAFQNLNVQNVLSGGTTAESDLRRCRKHRPALEDRHLQYLSHLHPGDRQQLRLQLRRLRSPRQLQLLPQRRPTRRSWPRQPADLIDRAESHPNQCRNSFRHLLCQGHPYPQGWSAVFAHLPARRRQPRGR